MPEARSRRDVRLARRIRSLEGKLRSPVPGLVRLIAAEEGAARWEVEIPALAVTPFEPLAGRAGGTAPHAGGDELGTGGAGYARPARTLQGAAGRGGHQQPAGAALGGGERATGSRQGARDGEVGGRGAGSTTRAAPAPSKPGATFAGGPRSASTPRSERLPPRPPDDTLAPEARERSPLNVSKAGSPKTGRRRASSVGGAADGQGADGAPGVPTPASFRAAGRLPGSSSSGSARDLSSGTGGERGPAGRSAPDAGDRRGAMPPGSNGNADPPGRWLALLDTLSSRALARRAPGRRSSNSDAPATAGEMTKDRIPSPSGTNADQTVPVRRRASILRPDRRDASVGAPRAAAALHPGEPENDGRHMVAVDSASGDGIQKGLIARHSPAPPFEAADLADLVNDALIEQARRHGVDL